MSYNYNNNESFEQWKERRQNEIILKYADLGLSLDELYSSVMTPEEKSEFMSAQDFFSSIKTTESKYKNKVIDYDEHLEKKAQEFVQQQKKNPATKKHLEHVARYSVQYAKKVNNAPDQKELRFNRKEIRQKNLIRFNRENFLKFFNKYLRFRFHDREFVLDSINGNIIAKLMMYFVRDERLESSDYTSNPWSLDKGILLFGSVGTGKTSILTAFSEFTKDLNLCTKFDMVNFKESESFCTEKGNVYLHKFKGRDFCHDELTAKKVKSYGNEISPSEYLIQQSYNRYEKAVKPTHWTTNATPDELKKLLDHRTFSRLEASCNFVCLGGSNRRPKQQ